MLGITIPARDSVDAWDEKNEKFITIPGFAGAELLLEHSLVSLSKWEEKTGKAFLGPEDKTREETIEYIRCMCLSPYDPQIFEYLTPENIQEINDYITAKKTATVINEPNTNRRNNREFITAEIIYYWMISLQIPMEAQYWHLDRLITQVRVINLKNQPEKKQRFTKSSLASRRAEMARRRAEMGTTG